MTELRNSYQLLKDFIEETPGDGRGLKTITVPIGFPQEKKIATNIRIFDSN